jgi:hypothetical protein
MMKGKDILMRLRYAGLTLVYYFSLIAVILTFPVWVVYWVLTGVDVAEWLMEGLG